MSVFGSVLIGVFVLGTSLILTSMLCTSLFFKLLNKIIDASEGGYDAEW